MTLLPTANSMTAAQQHLHASVTDWLTAQTLATTDARSTYLQQFAQQAWPTQTDEDWKYTSLSVLEQQSFAWSPATTQAVSELPLPENAIRLVWVNGHFDAQQSSPLTQLAQGLNIDIADIAHEDTHLLGDDALARLAQAGTNAYLRIRVARNQIIDTPIVIQQFGQQASANAIYFDVDVGESAALTLIEVTDAETTTLSLTQANMQVAANAQLTHLLWLHLADTANAFAWRSVDLQRDARFFQRSLMTSGQVSRHHLTVNVLGEGAESNVATAVVALEQQIQDMRTHTRHACLNAQSEQLHRFVVGGSANGVFHGDIFVEKGADLTNANMATNNLLISPTAQVNSKPQLEIYADEVRCTHGVTSGQVDEAQVFYLRARGIPEAQARFIISAAYAQAAIADVPVDVVAQAWREHIDAQLAKVA